MKLKIFTSFIFGVFLISLASASITSVTPTNGTFSPDLSNNPITFTSSTGGINVYVGDENFEFDEDNLICSYASSGTYTCNFTGYIDTLVNDKLLAHYRFDRTNTKLDETGDFNITTVSGAIHQNNTGFLLDSYNFDGINDYLVVPYDSRLNFGLLPVINFSFNIWVKSEVIDQSVSTWVMRQHRDGWGIGADVGFFCMWRTELTSAYPAVTLTISTEDYTDKWTMITCSYEGTTLKGYLNGELIGTSTTDGTLEVSTNSDYIIIGNEVTPTTGTRAWDGNLDEFTIWDKSLSDEEVMDLYHYGTQKYCFKINNSASEEYVGCFFKDLNNPTIKINEPIYESENGVINAEVTDLNNISMNVTLDGISIYNISANDTTQIYINNTELSLGSYNLTVVSEDLAGSIAIKTKLFRVIKIAKIDLRSESGNVILRFFSDTGMAIWRFFV